MSPADKRKRRKQEARKRKAAERGAQPEDIKPIVEANKGEPANDPLVKITYTTSLLTKLYSWFRPAPNEVVCLVDKATFSRMKKISRV